jgi:hypothetical protein
MKNPLEMQTRSLPIFASLAEALLAGYEFYDEGEGGYLLEATSPNAILFAPPVLGRDSDTESPS